MIPNGRVRDRMKGAVVGLAIGDALGAPHEFSARGPKHVEYQEATNWKLPAGGWTDDTAQALCIMEGLAQGGTPEDIIKLFVRWMEEGHNACTGRPVGIGGTVLKALMNYRVTGRIMAPTDEHSAGNGCIMRLAPAAAYYFAAEYQQMEARCLEICKLTHAAPAAQAAVFNMTAWFRLAFNGYSKDAVVSMGFPGHKDMLPIWNKEYLKKTANGTIEHKFGNVYHTEAALKSDGYCINTLECAVWALMTSDSFEEGMKKAIELGGDTDTVGAVYGQLAGAVYGYDALPQRWKDGLVWHDKIVNLFDRMIEHAEKHGPDYQYVPEHLHL